MRILYDSRACGMCTSHEIPVHAAYAHLMWFSYMWFVWFFLHTKNLLLDNSSLCLHIEMVEISRVKTRGLFGSCFQELFSVLEKKHKKLVWGRGCVFVFCVFRIFKNHFFYNNKKMFSLFFHCSNNNNFFLCVFS